MKTETKYILVREKYQGDFVKSVNEKISKGWQPLGGVSYASAGKDPFSKRTGNSFIQAMVRYRKVRSKSSSGSVSVKSDVVFDVEDKNQINTTQELLQLEEDKEKSRIEGVQDNLSAEDRAIVDQYLLSPSLDTARAIAESKGRSTKSVVAQLINLRVYKRK